MRRSRHGREPLITTVLITGASGFIGSHLSPALLAAGLRVRGTYRTQVPQGSSLTGVEWVQVREVDENTDWSKALDGVDYVVHLIGVAHHIGKDERELVETFRRVNVGGTSSLVRDVARSNSVKRVVFLSSAKAMGYPSAGETPNSEYGRSKLAAEEEISRGLAGGRSDWCILRPCLVYGPGNLGNMERLVRLIDTGIPLPLGGIRNRKSFLFVGNLISAIEKAMFAPQASRRRFSLSDGASLSTTDLVRNIAALRPRGVRVFPFPVRLLELGGLVGDQVQRLTGRSIGWDSYSVDRLCSSLEVDCTEFCAALQWSPPYSMEQGLAITLGAESSGVTPHTAANPVP